jgi:succinyl-CoA synthetase beta subunit
LYYLKDPNVKAILINIFGGIVRCDRVAQGVDAYKTWVMLLKCQLLFVYKVQCNCKELIDNSGMPIYQL